MDNVIQMGPFETIAEIQFGGVIFEGYVSVEYKLTITPRGTGFYTYVDHKGVLTRSLIMPFPDFKFSPKATVTFKGDSKYGISLRDYNNGGFLLGTNTFHGTSWTRDINRQPSLSATSVEWLEALGSLCGVR